MLYKVYVLTLLVQRGEAPDERSSFTVSSFPLRVAIMSGVFPYCKSGDSDNTIWMYIEQYRHSLLYISNHILEWEHKHNSHTY